LVMSTEDVVGKARGVITKLRTAEALIRSGKLDDGVRLFNEVTKEAREAGLFDNYIAIIRKIRRLIKESQLKQSKASKAEAKSSGET